MTNIAIENGHCIVDLPIGNGDVPAFFVCLPEGNTMVKIVLSYQGDS